MTVSRPANHHRRTAGLVFFADETRGGKLFDVALFIAIMLSAAAMILSSMNSVQQAYGP